MGVSSGTGEGDAGKIKKIITHIENKDRGLKTGIN